MTDTASKAPTTKTTKGETSPVATRVAALREQAESDPGGAREAAWSWIGDFRDRAGSDGSGAEADLNEIYRLGTPPKGLDGPTDGILVSTTTNPLLDKALKALTDQWMPWQGKRFDAAASTGDNRMTDGSELPAKALSPRYKMKEGDTGKLAYDFNTYVEAGKHDPDIQVMVIDYSGVGRNPPIIRQIRDELVEIVPGAYLGKILAKLPRDNYGLIGFFALTHEL